MAKKLEQWKNTLSIEKIVEGMNAASSNSKRLLKDAEILFENKRYPSATSLAILSIEEAGKIAILRELAVSKEGKDVKAAWNSYRSHTKKNVMWIFLDTFNGGARSLSDFSTLFENDSEHPYILDHIKQISFYTDCLGKKNWSVPEEVIDKEIAKSIIFTAKPLVLGKKHTIEELTLWVKIMSPVWNSTSSSKTIALKKYFDTLIEKGFVSGNINVSDFLGIKK